MKRILTLLTLLLIFPYAVAGSNDYTSRSYLSAACELFAMDAWHAAANYGYGTNVMDIIKIIDEANVSESEKDRAIQALQLVWNNRLDNPVLAYTVAMGLCLKPRHEMAPMEDLWLISPRTISGNI